MRYSLEILATVLFCSGISMAASFPIAPPGSTVDLQGLDFCLGSPDTICVHPGFLGPDGFPEFGTSAIGVCKHPIYEAVYLWETSGGWEGEPFPGPIVEVGIWDGREFTPWGVPLQATYLGTGVVEDVKWGYDEPWPPFREITSSVIPLTAFGVPDGVVNAIRVSTADWGHNQVTAVAVGNIPEPSTFPIAATGIGVMLTGSIVRRRLRARLRR